MFKVEMLARLEGIYNKTNLEKGVFAFVKKFYLNRVGEMAGNAELYPIIIKVANKKPLSKTELVMLSFSVFENETIYKAFLQTLPSTVQLLIEKLLWIESLTEEEAKELIKDSIVEEPKYSYQYNAELKKEFYFFNFLARNTLSYPYRSGYTLYLDPLLKNILSAYYAKPRYYDLLPLNKIPESRFTFNAEKFIIPELTRVISYYLQGNIKYTSSGKPAEATLSKLKKACNIAEFYNGEDEIQSKTRTSLIAGMLYEFKVKNVHIDAVEVIKLLFTKYYLGRSTSAFILGQLKGWSYVAGNEYNDYAEDELYAIFKQLPTGKWIGAENLQQYIQFRAINVKPIISYALNNRVFYEHEVKSTRGSYKDKRYIGADANALVNYPFIRGTIFLLASFGLLEIAYADINTEEYNKTYYSFYDGLMYFRLTDLGAYIFGQAEAYEPEQAIQHNKLQFSEDSLVILAEGDAGVLDVMLANYAEKIGTNRYHVNYAAFFKDCKTKKDIENKIVIFKKTIAASLPSYWETQFNNWIENAGKIKADNKVQAFKIPVESKDLQRIIVQDITLKDVVLKAEQFYILVKQDNVARFKNRMKELGYIIE